jgi:hypothetical protein
MSRAHPLTDADRAALLNIAYQKDLAAWKALPFLKRLRTKKPQPPQRASSAIASSHLSYSRAEETQP